MDRFRPSADVLIARFVVVEIGEFYRDIMREIWETAVEIPEHFPLLHAPPEHVSCCLQMAQIILKRGQEGFERDVLLQAEQPMQGRFSRYCHGILLKSMGIYCTTFKQHRGLGRPQYTGVTLEPPTAPPLSHRLPQGFLIQCVSNASPPSPPFSPLTPTSVRTVHAIG